MADAVLDIAGLETAAADSGAEQIDSGADSTVEETAGAENTGEESEGGEGGEGGEGKESETKNADGTDKTPEQIAKDKESAAKNLPGDKNTPQHIRKTLKAIQDADPANKKAVQELHGSYERWNAAKQIFPKGVQEMKDAKALIDLVGGQEGYETFTQQKAAIEAVDQKLYNADPTLIDDILADLKEENKLEAFPKIALNFLNRLQKDNADAYYEQMIPHFVGLLEEVNINGVLTGLVSTLSALKDDSKTEDVKAAVQKALGIADKADKWMKNMQSQNKKAKENVESPERKAIDAERKKLDEEKTQWKTNQTNAFKQDVATASSKADNDELGKALSPFLQKPFFKGFTRENLTPLATTLQTNLREALKADKTYQAQMKALWGAKEPSKEKILQFHSSRVKDITQRIVRTTVERMYPGYTKGGAAAGRVAAANAKADATKAADTKAAASGKPVYVVSKPKDLVRNEDIVVGGKPYRASDLITMEITGKGFVKSADGKTFKFVTWRK